MVERPSTAPLTNLISENVDRNQRPSTGSTVLSAAHTTRTSSQRKKLSQTEKSDFIRDQNKQEKSIESNGDYRIATEKE
ncbi:unnamed protein product, partial [Rotaria magnacalcarata]